MIFYFSGTGNSLFVAKTIAKKHGLKLVDIAEKMLNKQLIFVPEDGEIIGFVFPVYAWAPPKIVLDFIRRLQLARKNNYIFAVCTCGTDSGNAMEVLRDTLMTSQIPLNADFSVTMPENYIMMFNVSSQEKQELIFKKANEKLIHINEAISKRQNLNETERGRFAALKTKLIWPLFNKFANPSKRFSITSACNSCGFCAEVCPIKSITLNKEGKPVWSDKCLSCLACIHRCPRKAIEWGARTINKARYYNPNCDKINV